MSRGRLRRTSGAEVDCVHTSVATVNTWTVSQVNLANRPQSRTVAEAAPLFAALHSVLIQVRDQPRSVLLPLAGDVVAGGYPDCPISLYLLRRPVRAFDSIVL